MMEPRGRSGYVTLKPTPILKAALIVLAVVALLAVGKLWGEWAAGRPLSESTLVRCDQCAKSLDAGDQGNVILHEGCRETWFAKQQQAKAKAEVILARIHEQGLGEVLKEEAECRLPRGTHFSSTERTGR